INITPYNGNSFYMGIIYPLKWDAYLQSWYIDSALIDTQYTNIDTLNFVWAQPAGNYYIIVADGSGSGCYIEKYIQIHEPSAPLTLHKTFEHNICKGDSTGWINVVPSGGTPPYYYNWSNGVTTAYNGTLAAGTYTVGVRDINGCMAIESTDIYEPFREVILIPDTHSVSCRDNHDGYAAITGIENGFAPFLYSWSTGATDNYISDLDSGYYSVTVTDANNCTATETYHIGMINCGCITIYNVITPDGNGKNDNWIIKNIHLYPDAEVQVFNRWGKLVFSASAGYDNSWDGTSEGKELDSGDYYYVVILNMGDYPPYTGPVKILK
ncbi:MAG: gliding motility-associated C-terminal domain-containing protein, partial [Bacteroidota bacterium]